MTNNDEMPGRLVKIARNGERFWLRNVSELNGRRFGQVDNYVMNQPFEFGEIIDITKDEIIMEHQCNE